MADTDALSVYVWASAVWHFIRGIVRIVDPVRVFRWFEHHPTRAASKLEIYNLQTDALGLIAIGLLQIAGSGFPHPLKRNVHKAPQPITQATTVITVLHHFGTAILACRQWLSPDTTTGAFSWGFGMSTLIGIVGVISLVREQSRNGNVQGVKAELKKRS